MATHSGSSCLENPMVRGAWWATVRGVSKSQDTTEHAHTHTHSSYLKRCREFFLQIPAETGEYDKSLSDIRTRGHEYGWGWPHASALRPTLDQLSCCVCEHTACSLATPFSVLVRNTHAHTYTPWDPTHLGLWSGWQGSGVNAEPLRSTNPKPWSGFTFPPARFPVQGLRTALNLGFYSCCCL